MSKRIYWKKGMRLTDEVLTASDCCTSELIGKAILLSAGGKFGLFPASRPLNIHLDINKNIIEVVSLSCLGITRDGTLIDVQFDSNYTNAFDTKTIITTSREDIALILCISPTGEWRDTNDGMCEPVYAFTAIEENSSVPANALPIARIVYAEYSWRVDDINFVPPCLFVSSHAKFEELYLRFNYCLNRLDILLPQKMRGQKDELKICWPVVQQLAITMDKEKELMSPMTLLSNVQKCISVFAILSVLDEHIDFGRIDELQNYVHVPYNYRDIYQTIVRGLELCNFICTRIETFESKASEPVQVLSVPTVSTEMRIAKTNHVKIEVNNVPNGAVLYYSVDGSEPNIRSNFYNLFTFDPQFSPDRRTEPDKIIMIKVRYEFNGNQSQTGSYQVTIRKHKMYYVI